MKRVAKQRRFGPGEFASIARQCMDVIMKGENVFDFLASKGVTDPINEWYDIRRWIKSNAPDQYASLPISLKLETPVRRVNPEKKEEPKEEATMPEVETKRRAGRPPKAKEEETVTEEKKPRKAPQKAKAKIIINEVQGQKLTYTRQENGTILFHVPGFAANLTLRIDEIRTMMSELPEVVKILGK